MIKIGTWLVDSETCTLRQGDEVRKIPPRAMDVLVLLAEKAPQVVSVETLLDELWSPHSASDHAVHKALAALRQAFGDSSSDPEYIKTFPKRGYAIIAEVGHTADVRKSPTAATATLPQSRKIQPWQLVSLTTLACSLVFTLGWFFIPARDTDISPGATTAQTILLSPVEYLGTEGDTQNSYLALGLESAISANLSKLPAVHIQKLDTSQSPTTIPPKVSHTLVARIIELDSKLMISVDLTNIRTGTSLYSDQLQSEPDNLLAAQDLIVDNIVKSLRVFLDDDQRKEMHDWGTSNPLAYDHFIRADFYKDQWNHEDWKMAVEQFRKAIDLDPMFVAAYTGMATAVNYMAVYSTDSEARQLNSLLSEYTRRLSLLKPKSSAVETMKSISINIEGMRISELASLYKQRILAGNAPAYVFAQYGLYLQGARFYDEADQFFALARSDDPYKADPNQSSNFRTGSLTPWEAIPIKKQQLFDQPGHIGMLGTLVRFLSLTGNLEEAAYYLDRQSSVDTVGIRTHLSKISLSAGSGELFALRELGENAAQLGAKFNALYPELLDIETLEDQDLQFNNGVLFLILGEIDTAADHWRRMTNIDRRKLYTRLHASELLFPETVLNSDAYHSLLEEMGVGISWQRQLMQEILDLTPVTGIDLSEQSREAFANNQFMSQNNLWDSEQWQRLNNMKPVFLKREIQVETPSTRPQPVAP